MFYRLKKKNSVKVEALSTPFQKAVMLISFFEPVFAAVHFDNKINSFTVHSCLEFVWGFDPPSSSPTPHGPHHRCLLRLCFRVASAFAA